MRSTPCSTVVPLRIAGIGALFTAPAHRGRGHARALVEQLLEQRGRRRRGSGAPVLDHRRRLLRRLGFEPIATTGSFIEGDRGHAARGADDARPRRRGARPGGRGRASDASAPNGTVFHLDRDRDFLHYAIVKKRLLAGLGPAGDRELQFFIAEEGASAVAYVVDHRPRRRVGAGGMRRSRSDGARVGAILQVLIARDPSAPRPAITRVAPGRLPAAADRSARRAAVAGHHDDACRSAGRCRSSRPADGSPVLARRHVLSGAGRAGRAGGARTCLSPLTSTGSGR